MAVFHGQQNTTGRGAWNEVEVRWVNKGRMTKQVVGE